MVGILAPLETHIPNVRNGKVAYGIQQDRSIHG
jgi:hypothetical protein